MKKLILLIVLVSFSQSLFADQIEDLIKKAKSEALAKNKPGMVAAMTELASIKEKKAEFGLLEICYWADLPEDMKEACQPFARKGVPIKTGASKIENKPSRVIIISNSTPPARPQQIQQVPICYIAETGSKYHKNKGCSVKGDLSPVYDTDILKRRGLTACKKCWSGSPLY